jgi:hypothetical protein
VPDVPRRVLDRGPIVFDQLRLDNQTAEELQLTRQVIQTVAGPPDSLAFVLLSIPTLELIESLIIESVVRKRLTPEIFDYKAWRRSGALEGPMRDVFAYIDRERRKDPESEEHKTRVEELEALYAAGAQLDPLIAKPLDQLPLSSGADAVVVLDGRHRLFAAAGQGVDELAVYVVAVPVR